MIVYGPSCVFRLKKNNKIIYLFGELHTIRDKEKQYELTDYIKDNTKNIKNSLDIIIEQTNLNNFENLGNTYLANIIRYMNNNIINDEKKIKNDVSKIINDELKINDESKIKNVRFYYGDIRNYFGHNEFNYLQGKISPYLKDKNLIYIYYSVLLLYLQILIQIQKHIFGDNITQLTDEYIETQINKIKELNYENVNNLINSLQTKIKDKNIKINITKILNKININISPLLEYNIHMYLNKIIQEIMTIFTIILNYLQNKQSDIIINLKNIDNWSVKLFGMITDCYIIYCINKPYITNCIVITGQAHTLNLLEYYIKKNYDLTHMSIINFKNTKEELYNYFKNINSHTDIYIINSYFKDKISDGIVNTGTIYHQNIYNNFVDISTLPNNFA